MKKIHDYGNLSCPLEMFREWAWDSVIPATMSLCYNLLQFPFFTASSNNMLFSSVQARTVPVLVSVQSRFLPRCLLKSSFYCNRYSIRTKCYVAEVWVISIEILPRNHSQEKKIMADGTHLLRNVLLTLFHLALWTLLVCRDQRQPTKRWLVFQPLP